MRTPCKKFPRNALATAVALSLAPSVLAYDFETEGGWKPPQIFNVVPWQNCIYRCGWLLPASPTHLLAASPFRQLRETNQHE